MSNLTTEQYITRLVTPSPPVLILIGLTLLNIIYQYKRVTKKQENCYSTELEQRLAKSKVYCFLFEEIIVDVSTLAVASLGINWLYYHWRPVAWFCVMLPILCTILMLVMKKREKRMANHKKH
jgi:hypothetical protein